MKTTTLMAALALMLVLSCQKTSRTSTEEPTLTVTAPSGHTIAGSLGELKKRTASLLANSFAITQDVTITAINYLPVRKGYAATVHFRLADGQTGSYGILSRNLANALTPSISNIAANANAEEDASYMLVCRGTCQCKASMTYNKTTSDLSWSCGCDECDGTLYEY